MELTQRLATCKQCEKRKFNPNTGLVCSLTLRKPEFENDCNEFLLDPKEVSKMNAKTHAAHAEQNSGSSLSTWGIIVIVIFVVRMLLRMLRD